MFKCYHRTAPGYLIDCVKKVQPNRQGLRSDSECTFKFIIPKTLKKTFADRSFGVQGPLLWNNLPLKLKLITTFNNFKSQL